jgi:hypothetical protein
VPPTATGAAFEFGVQRSFGDSVQASVLYDNVRCDTR